MLDQFQEIELKFNDLERKMSDPELIADVKRYQSLVKQHSELKLGVELYRRLKLVLDDLSDLDELKDDPDMTDFIIQESESLTKEKDELERKLKLFLIPKDVEDEKNAVIEIRSGTGGDEAALFAASLYRMYTKYAEDNAWSIDVLSQNVTGLGGIKEISFSVSGTNVYGKLKFESGTHRVQRVPDTESSGRIHTSAATVAIMPEAEEVDVDIDLKECRIDTYRASGAGGQHVNKTDSAVRITHLPSGLVVACQDERSQFQNKDKALRLLRTKLYEVTLENSRKEESQARKLQVGTGDRSQKIRTYNYPQSRVTDHRINLTLYALDAILNGDLNVLVDPLIEAYQLEKMKSS
ncbi:peptide chain release factor 1 [bacterium]|nr:peptide chain release factor 1 [Actinomycetota bacterium]MBE33483.1 peptide chain release factor 1 [bacterium]|tara:strand:+ start:22515 stop:23570 length:1056 start_codon:yes stop_codon:yes gene_type:complete